MELSGIFDKAQTHAEALGIIASVWSRSKEGDMGQGIIGYFTDWNPNGIGIGAILKADTDLAYLKDKLFNSNHLYSLLVKIGGGLYLAGEFDLPLIGKYKTLGWKLLKAGVAAGLVLPGSGPYDQPGRNETPPNANLNKNRPTSSYSGAY
jgi:hypothetical protein